MNIKEAIIYGKEKLQLMDIEYSPSEPAIFLGEILNITKVQVLTNPDKELLSKEEDKYKEYINRRLKNEPVAYIINKCEFMSLDFYVDENVLIPRPDTENLVEVCIQLIKDNNITNAIDMCTGSGCISISLAKYANIEITGVDISQMAIDIAKLNSKNNNTNGLIKFMKSDLFCDIIDLSENKVGLIVSNPPYISKKEMEDLLPNVINFEPYLALEGGVNGLYFYEEITKSSIKYLKNNGYLAYEIGFNQGELVSKIMKENGFTNIKIQKDLAGFDRVVYGKIIK